MISSIPHPVCATGRELFWHCPHAFNVLHLSHIEEQILFFFVSSVSFEAKDLQPRTRYKELALTAARTAMITCKGIEMRSHTQRLEQIISAAHLLPQATGAHRARVAAEALMATDVPLQAREAAHPAQPQPRLHRSSEAGGACLLGASADTAAACAV